MRAAQLAAVLGLPLLAGCESLGYYAQAVGGHLGMMSAARPVEALLADPETPHALRARLETARRVRAFASRALALPDNASYTSYADLGRRYALWNVFAAGEFSVEARRQCFPFAGCVAYRGFFAEERARAHAARLAGEGDDVFVAGVRAYSTLGWFSDPLLSTFVDAPDAELAGLLFHELAHQLIYVKDDTTFNESFAVTVEQEGVRRWLESEQRGAELAAVQQARLRRAEFGALVEATRARLALLYRAPLAPDALRERKRAEFARLRAGYAALKARWGGYAGYDGYLAAEPNNALLVALSSYARLVPEFERLLAQSAGDLPAFYARVRSLAALSAAERASRLQGR